MRNMEKKNFFSRAIYSVCENILEDSVAISVTTALLSKGLQQRPLVQPEP
jgi:hypothetical protein